MVLVVHASRHGTSRRYAEWIAEDLGTTALSSREVSPDDLARADAVVFCASIYGPVLRDSGTLTAAMDLAGSTAWTLATVGMSDPAVTTKRDALVDSILGPERRACLSVFHLRGALDYTSLNFVEKSTLKGIATAIRHKPGARSAEDEAMLAVLTGSSVDLVDRAAIEPIVASVRSGT